MAGRRRSFYSDEEVDELDVHIRRGRSPHHQPVVYPEHRYRTVVRPYDNVPVDYLVPAPAVRVQRAHSTGRRPTPPAAVAPAAQPVIINNKIYSNYEDDDYIDTAPKHRARSHSRTRAASIAADHDHNEYIKELARREIETIRSHEARTKADLAIERAQREARNEIEQYKAATIAASKTESELEKARSQLAAFKLRESNVEEAARIKSQLELQKFQETIKENAAKEKLETERQKRELADYKRQKEHEEEERRYKKDLELARLRETYKTATDKDDYEYERTKKELAAYRAAQKAEEEEKRMKKEYELERMKREKKEAEEKARIKKEHDALIEKYKFEEAERQAKAKKEHAELIAKIKAEEAEKAAKEKKEHDDLLAKIKAEEAEKAAKEKKEKEEKEKEYQHRLEDDLRKSGMDERQIAVVLKKDTGVDPNRPTYTRMSRRHLSIETLNRYRIDYQFDQDPEYVLIKRWVPEYEQDFLWNHTREIRERRREQPVLLLEERRHTENVLLLDDRRHHSDNVVMLEAKKKHHHETEFELVRKKKHERRPSPSPLLTFLAGGQRR